MQEFGISKMTLNILVSSAYVRMVAVRTPASISEIGIAKRSGPRTDPCGTPDVTHSFPDR